MDKKQKNVYDNCIDILETVKTDNSKMKFKDYFKSSQKKISWLFKRKKTVKKELPKKPVIQPETEINKTIQVERLPHVVELTSKQPEIKPVVVKPPVKSSIQPLKEQIKVKAKKKVKKPKVKRSAIYTPPYVEQNPNIVITINKMWKNVAGEDSKALLSILTDVSLEIGYGEIVIILGPSGSGKTTLLNLIGGYDSISLGSCVVANCPLEQCSPEQLLTYRKINLGYVYQRYNLIDLLSAYDNIAITQNLIPKKDRKLKIEELAKQIGIHEILFKFPYEMSGGQKQRVAIARAIIKEPKLLLCDEPTGALDSASAENIINLLQEINKKYNQTILLVTHDESLSRIANRIIKISDGQIVSNELVRPLSKL